MKNKIRLISILCSVTLCFSAFAFSASAVGEDIYNETPNQSSSQITDNANNNSSSISDNNNYSNNDAVGNNDTNNYYSNNNNNDYYSNNNDSNDYYSGNNNSSSSYNDNYYSNDVYGGNSSSNYSATTPVQKTTENLYNQGSSSVDSDELSNSDWDQISKSLQSADAGTGDDFNFIKNNNSTEDNGLWMLIVGVLSLILAVIGFTYIILTSVKGRKKKAYAGSSNGHRPQQQQHRPQQRPQQQHPVQRSQQHPQQRPVRRPTYDDQYSQARVERKRRNQDTADIQLPSSYQRNNHGNHYR